MKWSRSVVSDSLRPHGLQPTMLLHPWDSPGKSTGVGCHFLLQGIFLTRESNLGLPHSRQILYHLSQLQEIVKDSEAWHVAVLGITKSWTRLMAQTVKRLPAIRETRVQSLGWEDPLEKEMAAHSSILAWKIPWTKEPGRLQSMGSQRVGHDWATSLLHFTSWRLNNMLLNNQEMIE